MMAQRERIVAEQSRHVADRLVVHGLGRLAVVVDRCAFTDSDDAGVLERLLERIAAGISWHGATLPGTLSAETPGAAWPWMKTWSPPPASSLPRKKWLKPPS